LLSISTHIVVGRGGGAAFDKTPHPHPHTRGGCRSLAVPVIQIRQTVMIRFVETSSLPTWKSFSTTGFVSERVFSVRFLSHLRLLQGQHSGGIQNISRINRCLEKLVGSFSERTNCGLIRPSQASALHPTRISGPFFSKKGAQNVIPGPVRVCVCHHNTLLPQIVGVFPAAQVLDILCQRRGPCCECLLHPRNRSTQLPSTVKAR
jgi:hypothetical protein